MVVVLVVYWLIFSESVAIPVPLVNLRVVLAVDPSIQYGRSD